jgi:putative ABC transport system permease protein
VLRSFDGLALRQIRTRPLRALLTAFGVMLGVGMVFGVLLLVGTIRHTFDDLIGSAFGEQELLIAPKAGTVPAGTVDRVKATPGVENAGGMVGGLLTRMESRGHPVKGPPGKLMVAGIDPFAMNPYQMKLVQGRGVIFGPEIMLEKNWARERGLGTGDSFRVATPIGPARIKVVGIFRFSSGLSFGGQGLAAMPMREARRLMELPAGFSQITVKVARASDMTPVQRRLQAKLGPGVEVKTPQGFGDDIKAQLESLNVVLYFFSGVALFVGGFLILNNFNMTVLQRIREIGMLRTLGASRRMIARTVLAEALAVGVVGTILGLGLGIGLASGLVAMMRAIEVPVGGLQISAGAAVTAAILGMVVTAAGAFWPARRAGRVPPIRAALGDTEPRRRPSLVRGAIGLALFLPGMIFGGELWMGNTGAGSGMVAMAVTMVMFVGMAMAAPFVILPVVQGLAPVFRRLFPAGGRLAVDAVLSNAMRTAATAAALTIGLSVVVVNSSMSASFLGTIRDQIDQNFARDFTVQAQGYAVEQGGGPGVPKELARQVAAFPETAVATPVRVQVLKLPKGGDQPGLMFAFDPAQYGKVDKGPIKGISRTRALAAVARGGVIVNTDYAKVAGLKRGDHVPLAGPQGRHDAEVVGVLDSMGDYAGSILQMSLDTMERLYGNTPDTQLAVKARSDALAPALQRRIDALIQRRYPNLEVASAADRKAEVNKQISTQFNFFNAIVAIAVIVSLLGVVNTLAMSVIERTREIGVLRALGSSRWLVRQTMLDESLLITVAGAIAGILLGLMIGWFWIASMGDLMPGIAFHLPTGTIIGVAIAAVIAGVVAAMLPARRAARLKVVRALSYE